MHTPNKWGETCKHQAGDALKKVAHDPGKMFFGNNESILELTAWGKAKNYSFSMHY